MILILGAAPFVVAATIVPKGPFESPAPASETAIRVRLQKLGYGNVPVKLVGNYWTATVTKDGVVHQIRIGASSGVKYDEPVRPEEKPATH